MGDVNVSTDSLSQSNQSYQQVNYSINAPVVSAQYQSIFQGGKQDTKKSARKTKKQNREQHFIVRDLILALSLCHNVTPVFNEKDGEITKELQASSPDEVALVKFADSLGFSLL